MLNKFCCSSSVSAIRSMTDCEYYIIRVSSTLTTGKLTGIVLFSDSRNIDRGGGVFAGREVGRKQL